jgi:hypothetical protein
LFESVYFAALVFARAVMSDDLMEDRSGNPFEGRLKGDLILMVYVFGGFVAGEAVSPKRIFAFDMPY